MPTGLSGMIQELYFLFIFRTHDNCLFLQGASATLQFKLVCHPCFNNSSFPSTDSNETKVVHIVQETGVISHAHGMAGEDGSPVNNIQLPYCMEMEVQMSDYTGPQENTGLLPESASNLSG